MCVKTIRTAPLHVHKLERESEMVKRCVAAGCSNTNADDVSLFKFPRDQVLRNRWIKQVQRGRASWTATSYSVLCSKHFSDDCFQSGAKIAAQFGMQKTRRLKPDAVPTIFDKASSATSSTLSSRKRAADDLPSSSKTGSTSSACLGGDGGIVKKKRTAYEKRESRRVSQP